MHLNKDVEQQYVIETFFYGLTIFFFFSILLHCKL